MIGRRPIDIEVVAVDDAGLDDARLAEADQREFDGREFAERFDGGGPLADVFDLGDRERHAVDAESRRALADIDQPLFAAIDERAQQHAADDAEDRGVGADAERQRDHDGGGKSLRAQQRAQADAHVLQRAPPPCRTSGCTRRGASRRAAAARSRTPSAR